MKKYIIGTILLFGAFLILTSLSSAQTSGASACSTFAIGCYIKVSGCAGCSTSENIALAVRSTPSLSGAVVMYMSSGVIGQIVGGSVQADGHTWWDVDYQCNLCQDGWSSQAYLTLIPPPLPIVYVGTSVYTSNEMTWSSTYATTCVLSGGWSGTVGPSGKQTVSTTQIVTYTATCTGLGGSSTASYTPPPVYNGPTLSCSAIGTGCYVKTAGASTASIAVRNNPDSSDPIVGYQGAGNVGKVTAGPTNADNITWWKIDFSGMPDGWVNQNDLALSPIPIPYTVLAAVPTNSSGNVLAISPGQSVDLIWKSSNSTSCTASNGWSGSKATSGRQTVSPTITTNYKLDCTGPGGVGSGNVTVGVGTAAPAPFEIAFAADQTIVYTGTNATLWWDTVGMTSCTASGSWSGTKATSGSATVTPTSQPISLSNPIGSAYYTLTCTGPGGTKTKQVWITVAGNNVVRPVTLTATPMAINYGDPVTLTWDSNMSYCEASGGTLAWDLPAGQLAASGSKVVYPSQLSYSYQIGCVGSNGSFDAAYVTIAVNPAFPGTSSSTPTPTPTPLPPPPPPPSPTPTGTSTDIKANSTDGLLTLSLGQALTLSWNSGKTTCTLSSPQNPAVNSSVPPSGSVSYSASSTLYPTVLTTYVITCY